MLTDDQKLQPAYDAVGAFLAPAHRWPAYERRWTVPEAVAMGTLEGVREVCYLVARVN